MVSNFQFYSGKDINLRKSVSFLGGRRRSRMGLVFLIAFASTLPEMLFLLFSGYALSGYVLWAARGAASRKPPQRQRRRSREVVALLARAARKPLY